MKLSNVFYFKNIVDQKYPNEDYPTVDIQSVVAEVEKDIQTLSDDDFIEVIISCFIPDLYKGMGKCEKLFTKLTELMVGEWWRRIGGEYRLPTKKSGTEDVELICDVFSIVCDAKVFRLGRSQKAPNVKDFLKLASVDTWIENLNKKYAQRGSSRKVIGGLVTYSSLHEWEGSSEVYEECTNLNTPVIMLPYEVMSLLLKYKDRFDLSSLSRMWDYSKNQVQTSRSKSDYWDYVSSFICNLILITQDQYAEEMKEYHRRILLATAEYRKIVQTSVDEAKEKIAHKMESFTSYSDLKEYATQEILKRDSSMALDYLKHIDDFRYYRDQN